MTKELKDVDNTLDPDDITSKIEQAKIQLQKYVQIRDQKSGMIVSKKDLINNTQFKIDSVDEDKLYSQIDILKTYISDIDKLKNDLKLKQLKIQHAQKMVSKLDKHEWDPECKFCMANPWLQETKQIADLLPKLIDEEQQILFDIDDIGNKIDDLRKEQPREKIDLLNAFKSDVNKWKQLLATMEHEHSKCEWDVEMLFVKISDYKKQLIKAKRQKDNIEFNKKKNSEIKEIRDEITTVNSEVSDLDSRLLNLSGKLKMAEKSREDAETGINRLKTLEQQYQAYEYYQKAVNRDGVPYHLISKALPQIESEINNILNQIVDFTMVMDTDGKNINAYIVYDDDNYWPLELTSGMEKFISSLAIRTSLINVSNLPRPNFLAIDEGFGVLDSDNLNSMYMLFDYLKSQFGFILCISHIDAMRDIVDKLVEIKKVNGYSEIAYT